MASSVAIPLDEYLQTSYEHDREYVRGEVTERGMPNDDHSKLQAALAAYFWPLRASRHLHVRTELRCRLAADLIRIPDVAVFSPAPAEANPSAPPLAVVEIISPDDRFSALLGKCNEYHQWGVRHIWAVDPAARRLFAFDGRDLLTVAEWNFSEAGLVLRPNDLFD